MAFLVEDRVRETSTTTGTSSMALGGAETGYRAFSSVASDGDAFCYVIDHESNDEWEAGIGSYDATADEIDRDTVKSSSNSGNKVTFSSGSKVVLLSAISVRFPVIDADPSVNDLPQYDGTQFTNVAPGTGVNNDLTLDETVIKDGNAKEIDAAEFAAGNGTAGQVLLTDGAAASWSAVDSPGIATDAVGNSELNNADAFTLNGDLTLGQATQDYVVSGASDFINVKSQSAGTDFRWRFLTADQDGTDEILLSLFGVGNDGAADQSKIQMGFNSSNDRYDIKVNSIGTAPAEKLSVYASGNSTQLLLDDAGNVTVGAGDLTDGTNTIYNQSAARIGNDRVDENSINSSAIATGLLGGSGTVLSLDESYAATITSQWVWDTGAAANLELDETGPHYNTANAETLNVRNDGTGSVTLQQGGTAVVLETRALTGGDGIQPLGDLSADRTVAVAPADFTGSGLTTSGTPANIDVGAGTGITVNASDVELDSTVLVDGGAKELDVADLAGGSGTSGQVPQSDGAAVTWVTLASGDLSDFDEAAQDAVGLNFGAGLSYDDATPNFTFDESYAATITSGWAWDTGAGANLQVDETGVYYSTANAETLNFRNTGTGSVTVQQDGTAVVLETRSLTGGNAIDAIGDLSTDRTIAVSTGGIDTAEIATDAVGNDELNNADAFTFNGNLTITSDILDTNGNEQLVFTSNTSAVNHPDLANSAAGNAVEITTAGDDTNIDLVVTGKGTGGFVPQIPGDSGSGPVAIGGDHGSSVGDESVAIGKGARTLEDTGGTIANNHPRSTVVGFEAGNNTGSGVFGLSAFGYQAARNNTGGGVTANGYLAARNNTGSNVTANGYRAADNNTGNSVTANGYQAALNNTGNNVTANGYYAARDNTSNRVTANGYRAAQNNTQNDVAALGYNAVRGDGITASNMGVRVTGIGVDALRDNTGDDTIGLGYNAGGSNTGNDSVLIGRGAGENNSTASQFILAQTHVNATPLIQGDFSTAQVGIGTGSGISSVLELEDTAPALTFDDGGTNETKIQNELHSLTDDGTASDKTALQSVTGLVIVIDSTNGTTATFELDAVNNAVQEINDASTAFSTTEGNAGTINIYYDSTNTQFEAENNSGGTITLRVLYIGS